MTSLVEATLVALAISILLPLYGALAERPDGRDGRFADAPVTATSTVAPAQREKDAAMRTLLVDARWQWAGFAVLGLALLHLKRVGVAPVVGTAFVLGAWAAAGWLGRVPWPIAPIALAVASLVLLAASPWLSRLLPGTRSLPASAFAYPGFVAATGLGWLVLLDLSANGLAANRYLAHYHHGHLWLAMLVFGVVAFWREPIGRTLAWTLSFVDGLASRAAARLGALAAGLVFAAIVSALVVAIAVPLAHMRQLTSELGRLWLIVGAAWFFFLRGTPLTERLARRGGTLGSLVRYLAPLAFVVVVLIAAMVATHDMGPLLVAGYGAGAFVAASAAMWLYQRRGAGAVAFVLAIVLFAAWIVATTSALFAFGSLDDVTAARLENVASPLASANDQLALATWFQRAAPVAGFGPGAVPWCGFGATGRCAGVPAQIQSDYTFTALVGVFGWTGAWLVTLGVTLWLHAVVRAHGHATRGEPRLVRVGARLRNDEQALLGWIAVAWVVLTLCQLAVTVAGNLAVIPLTGVTFPFVSFGMTSLVVNAAMLALAASVTEPRGAT